MSPSPDWLHNLFLYVFLFGLIFTIISLIIGAGDGSDLDVGGDAALDLDAGGDSSGADFDGPGVFNLPTLMAFFTWFGGIGYLFTRTWDLGVWLAVPAAFAGGIFGGAVMFLLMARLLWPMMSKPMSSVEYKLPGTPARVVSSIRAGGVGEIVYTKRGNRFTAGARAVDDQPVTKGANVVIIRYERGMAYVQPVDKILQRGEAT